MLRTQTWCPACYGVLIDFEGAITCRTCRNVYSANGDLLHSLYKTGDEDAPDAILDVNNDVVLALCRRCGQAESTLAAFCTPPVSKVKGAALPPMPKAYNVADRSKAAPIAKLGEVCKHRNCPNYLMRPCDD